MQWTETDRPQKNTMVPQKAEKKTGDSLEPAGTAICLKEPIYLTTHLIIREKRGSLPRFSDFGNLQATEASQNFRQS